MNHDEDLNTKIWANLPQDVHTFFFRKIFAGDRGVKQQLIIDFFNALHTYCIRQGIQPEWNPDVGKQIRNLVKNLTFNEPASRPTRTRRTSRTPSKSKTQPASSGDVTGPAN